MPVEEIEREANLEEDRKLIERFKTEPRESFAALYEKYADRIYAFVLRRIGNDQEAQDLTAQVFLKAYEKLSGFQFQGYPFSAYLYRIASNELITTYRKRGGRVQVELLEQHAVTETIEKETEVHLAMSKVQEVLPELPEVYRKVLELKYFAQLGNQEIAETLGWTANRVGVTLFRALKKVQERLEATV